MAGNVYLENRNRLRRGVLGKYFRADIAACIVYENNGNREFREFVISDLHDFRWRNGDSRGTESVFAVVRNGGRYARGRRLAQKRILRRQSSRCYDGRLALKGVRGIAHAVHKNKRSQNDSGSSSDGGETDESNKYIESGNATERSADTGGE